MAPRGRPRRRNTRMDAAIDAMRPLGFSWVLVKRTVKELLNVYGGDDYWPFIEENGYRELIDILIEQNGNEGEGNVEEGENGRHLQNNSSQEQEAPTLSVCTSSDTVADLEPIGSDAVQAVPEIIRTEEVDIVALPQSCSPVRDMGCDPPVERNGSDWKDIRLDQGSDEKDTTIAVGNRVGFAQTNKLSDQISVALRSSTVDVTVPPTKRLAIRRPCYGWIGDDECELDVNDVIHFTPASRQTPPSAMLSEHSCGGTDNTMRRKSRWDSKPGES